MNGVAQYEATSFDIRSVEGKVRLIMGGDVHGRKFLVYIDLEESQHLAVRMAFEQCAVDARVQSVYRDRPKPEADEFGIPENQYAMQILGVLVKRSCPFSQVVKALAAEDVEVLYSAMDLQTAGLIATVPSRDKTPYLEITAQGRTAYAARTAKGAAR